MHESDMHEKRNISPDLHASRLRSGKRITAFFILGIFLVGGVTLPINAQDGETGFTVAGTISGITEDAALFVSIVDRGGWDASAEELQDPETLDGYIQGLRLNPDGATEMRYEFTNVPPGSYAIRAFLDSNGNEELDIGIFGPKEPWAIYQAPRPTLTPPSFNRVSFELSGPRDQMDMELR